MDTPLSWDDYITSDEEYVLLEEGDYTFEVQDMKRQVSSNQNDMVKLTLKVTDGSKSTTINDHLVLISSAIWKISSFLRSIGLKKHGENVPISVLEKAPGMSGRCHVAVEDYEKNGQKRQSNKISKYYDKEEDSKPVEAVQETIPW